MVKSRQCLCCSAEYSYCPDCSKKDALAPSWKSDFCSEDCMTIWKTAVKYNLNKISKAEAKSIIENLTLKPVEQYSKCVQRDLGVIFAKESKPKRGKRAELPILDEVIDTVINVKNNEELIVETEPAISNEAHEVVNKTEE